MAKKELTQEQVNQAAFEKIAELKAQIEVEQEKIKAIHVQTKNLDLHSCNKIAKGAKLKDVLGGE